VVVQITEEFDSNGSVTITITLPPASSTTQQHATGVVSEIEKDALMVHTADGSDLLLHMNADSLSNLNLESCQTVDVTYHQDAGLLIADQVNATGASTAGDCAPTYSETGTITQVSSGSLTVSTDHGPVSFTVDLSSGLTDGYKAGDLVNVTYTQNGDGSLTATDLCFVEESASGKVSSVTTNAGGGSLTITDDDTGQPDTFVADPQSGVQINSRAFNGVSVGDQVDVTYHQSAGRLVADSVTDH
jgi:Domain of unknown function (DUF5666)